jgi:hypothetical protein
MIVEFTFKDNAYAELFGDTIKFWFSTGLPDYEGSLEGFKAFNHKHFQQLLTHKVIKDK